MPRTPRPARPAALPTTFPTPAGAVAAARAGTPAGSRAATGLPTQGRRRARPPAPPAPLGSLVTAPAVARTACPRCGDGSVTHVGMTLTDGAAVTFVSCHACETSGWIAADGAPLGLATVLAAASRA